MFISLSIVASFWYNQFLSKYSQQTHLMPIHKGNSMGVVLQIFLFTIIWFQNNPAQKCEVQ